MSNNEPLPNGIALTLMYEILQFTKKRMANPTLVPELLQRIKEHELPVKAEMFALAQPEIINACELMVPGLLLDFLAENSDIFDREALSRWVKEKDQSLPFRGHEEVGN